MKKMLRDAPQQPLKLHMIVLVSIECYSIKHKLFLTFQNEKTKSTNFDKIKLFG